MILSRRPWNSRVIADRERSEPALGRLVEHHEPPAPQIGRTSLDDIPGKRPAAEIFQAVIDDRFLGPGGQCNHGVPDDEVVGPGHAGNRPHALDVGLGERVAEIDVGRVAGHHPEVGVELLDRDAGVLQEPEEEPHLDQDECDGKAHAQHGGERTGPCRPAAS